MKRIIYALFLLFSVAGYANEIGHFSFDLENEKITVEEVESNFSKWFNIDANTTFKTVSDHTDNIGMRHIDFQQYFCGIKVESCIIKVHIKNGHIQSVNGCVMENGNQSEDATKIISEKNSLRSTTDSVATLVLVSINTDKGLIYRPAYKHYDKDKNADIYIDAETNKVIKTIYKTHNLTGSAYTLYNKWQDIEYEKSKDEITLSDSIRNIISIDLDGDSISNLKEESFILNTNKTRKYLLSAVTIESAKQSWWYLSFFDTKPDFYIIIRDKTGNQIYKSNHFNDVNPPCTFNLSSKNVYVEDEFSIELLDYDPLNTNKSGGSFLISLVTEGLYSFGNSSSNFKGTFEITKEYVPYALFDIHWGLEKAYDYFKKNFDRNGFDNKNGLVCALYNPNSEKDKYSINNSAFMVNGFFYFGKGDGTNMNPVVSLDIVAHEYTHSITGTTNNNEGLTYKDESGALNESFSDIFGCSIEFHTLGDNGNWLIGEDVMIEFSNLRDLSNPYNSADRETPLPKTYKGRYWVTDTTDQGGVHTNCGVQNYWFYLLCEGGSGKNDNLYSYNVTGVGIEDAQQIVYRNLINYLQPNATYEDAVNGSLHATKDLFGKDSQQYSTVLAAWCAVGLCHCTTNVNEIKSNSDEFNVYSQDNKIIVKGDKGLVINIYNMLGKLIESRKSSSEEEIFNVNKNQAFIVSINNQSKKILVK